MSYIGIKNSIKLPLIVIPDIFKSKFFICSNIEISQHEAQLFSVALELVKNQLEKENKTSSDFCNVNIIFTENLSFEFVNTTNFALGALQNIILYAMYNLRKYSKNDADYIFTYMEELCHHIWRIEDEELVDEKVIEVLSTSGMNVTKEQLIVGR